MDAGRRFGLAGLVRWGAPAADEAVYKTMADYRARTGQHWVNRRPGRRRPDMVLRPCTGHGCALCKVEKEQASVRDMALAAWLADPDRRLPAAWDHPAPPDSPLWTFDVLPREHVIAVMGVSARTTRVGPCPPGRLCPQCAHGVAVLKLPG